MVRRRVGVVDSSNEGLREAIEALEVKIDGYIQSLPEKFIPRLEHDTWRIGAEGRIAALEARATIIEADNRAGKQWANDEHVKLANQVIESERRIIEKLDGQNKASGATRLLMFTTSFGWFLTIILSVIGWILTHR